MAIYAFQNWTVLNDAQQDVTSQYLPNPTSNIVTITLDQNLQLIANYAPVAAYTLNLIQTVGGTISSSKTSYNPNEMATITAVPDSNYTLTGWLRDGVVYDATSLSISFPMDANHSIQAIFTANAQYTLTLNQTTGGTISSSKTTYYTGETAFVTATASNGYMLTGWIVNGGAFDGTNLSISFIMDGNKSVQAVFEPIPTYTLTLNQTVNGVISSSKLDYTAGETAVVTASPNANCQLTGWLRDGAPYDNTSLSISFAMNSNHTVQATFALQNVTHSLILIQSDGGTISAPKLVYNEGETATITASAITDYSLTNWYVDSTIPTPPKDKANPLLLIMDADHYVQANFDIGGDAGNLQVYLTDFPPNTVVNVYVDGSTVQKTTNGVGYAEHLFQALPVDRINGTTYSVTATWTGGSKTVSVLLTSSGATTTITPAGGEFPWLFLALGGGLLLVGTFVIVRKGGKRR